jgi:hypothetical protein
MFDENPEFPESLWDRGPLTAHKLYAESTPEPVAVEVVPQKAVESKIRIISVA